MNRDEAIHRDEAVKAIYRGIEEVSTLSLPVRIYNALKESGFFTIPDQPAAPDEDAVARRLFMQINRGLDPDFYPTAFEDCLRAVKAGFTDRRPVDTRPTVSDALQAIADRIDTMGGWDDDKYSVVMECLVEAGILSPDPAPAAEVPVVEDEARMWQHKYEVLFNAATEFIESAALTKASDR